MKHILSLSYGKDSLACLGAIEQLGWRDAHELVEYAPIVKCGECRNFKPNGIDDNDFWDGTCVHNNDCDVNTDDFCSRGEKRSDGE